MSPSLDAGHNIFPRKFKASTLDSRKDSSPPDLFPIAHYWCLPKGKPALGTKLQSKLLHQFDVTKKIRVKADTKM